MNETIIGAGARVRMRQYLRELWEYRDLLRALVERDLRVRYKQTVFGVLWVVLPPLVNAFIFYAVFILVAEMPTPGLPPMLFFLAAQVPWNCFASGVSQAAGSLEGNAGLISKVYFPRLIVPLATILSTVVDFAIGWFFFNIVAMVWGYWSWQFIPFTIVLLELQLLASMGLGVIFAVLNAQYRDVRYVISWLLQIGMWITPVAWPAERLLHTRYGPTLKIFLNLNPMAGIIESYRAVLAGTYVPYRMLTWNFIVTLVILAVGIYFFRRREQRMVDLL